MDSNSNFCLHRTNIPKTRTPHKKTQNNSNPNHRLHNLLLNSQPLQFRPSRHNHTKRGRKRSLPLRRMDRIYSHRPLGNRNRHSFSRRERRKSQQYKNRRKRKIGLARRIKPAISALPMRNKQFKNVTPFIWQPVVSMK